MVQSRDQGHYRLCSARISTQQSLFFLSPNPFCQKPKGRQQLSQNHANLAISTCQLWDRTLPGLCVRWPQLAKSGPVFTEANISVSGGIEQARMCPDWERQLGLDVQGQVFAEGDEMGHRALAMSLYHVTTTDVVNGAWFLFPAQCSAGDSSSSNTSTGCAGGTPVQCGIRSFCDPWGQVKAPPDILLWRLHHASCCDGRAVKALDLKSNGVSPRRFKSCSQRELLLTAPVLLSTGGTDGCDPTCY